MTRILPLVWGGERVEPEAVLDAIISSSGYRFPCRAGHGSRKFHAEGGAAAASVGHFNGTAMLLNDTVRHAQPEAGALLGALGREEGIVNAVQVLGRDSVARVGDFD